MRTHTVSTIRTVGGLLPPETLEAITTGELDGLKPSTYGLAESETVREAANRSWERLRGAWLAFRRTVPPGEDPGHQVETTRSQWLRVLFDELGYGRLPAVPAGGLAVADTTYPLSHLWQRTPLHLLGVGVNLDHRTPGVPGAARQAPHSMMQELLNRSQDHLWGILTNGLELRLLRDSAALVRQAYVQFDLAGMLDGEVFADFTLMWQLCHASRVEPQPDPSAAPNTCWLERWREDSTTRGTRALKRLSAGVRQALNILGAGFLTATPALRDQLRQGTLTPRDYHRLVLRVVYQLLVLFVAEDRNLLHHDKATPEQRRRYAQHFSTDRLRRKAQRRHTTERHTDQWTALRLITRGLGNEEGLPALGLPGLGGIYDKGALGPLEDAALTNRDLLAAVRALSLTRDETGMARAVDYRNLGAEELGSVYESLLELVPDYDAATGCYTLDVAPGNDRKKTGSYYTPSDLVDVLLDETLKPVLDEAARSPDPEAALLAITVCDPACGSGHFLVAAGRRIARRLAAHRTGEAEPAEPALRDAMRDVISHCLYGVDLNPLAAELAKVALWLEALEPGRPLSFLDAHIKVGNALLGTTPELIDNGLPEAAFTPLLGDDSATLSKRKRRNRDETIHSEQVELVFGAPSQDFGRAFQELADAPENTLIDVHAKAAAWQAAEEEPALAQARLAADAWCAAFLWHHQPEAVPGPTAGDIRRITNQGSSGITSDQLDQVRRLRDKYHFFHWHLEFPDVLPEGFSCILGNPPWGKLKLKEQQYFAVSAPEIAEAANAAARKKMISKLEAARPALWSLYQAAVRDADAASLFARGSDRYPLTGHGDIDTYALFAETSLALTSKRGRLGVVLPTGIATGETTAPFFRRLIDSSTLAAFLDFENEAKIFPGVTNRFRFAVLVATGGQAIPTASFAFSTRHVHQIGDRRFSLQPSEILQVNPNSGTSPIFRSRRDAEITIGIHGRLPVLWHDKLADGNPWNVSFQRMLDMANDSGSFRDEPSLRSEGWQPNNGAFMRGNATMLPLYEAKMTHHFDHRYATYAEATQAQLNKGTLPRLTPEQHDDPGSVAWPRYWIPAADVDAALAGRSPNHWLLGWRDIAKDTDERTLIATVIPRTAVGHKFPLALPGEKPVAGLQANLSALVLDYCARQKLSGASVIYSLVKQLPVVPPSVYNAAAPWQRGNAATLADWVVPRVLELSYTAWDLQPYGQDLGDDGPPFRWNEERRAQLRAELDAAYLHLYGLDRSDAEHVIDSFFVVRKNEERQHGEFRTKRLVLAAYDAMVEGEFVSPLDPAPGQGQRHPDRRS
ncbi:MULTISPECIES: Eco57I restriction-modification methylase domain-containing protein [unclassified Crossiella]|uniref:Eco57I restriction-modification methylase domain-containing protein n=1 Tax=unclassified Crossiella TaxID=2620835 RepID=UPI001FFED2E2|nr:MULTISPECIES: DNA methyltransferase [unclassified Crossiella]MCK2238234.1 N-6 DNA methylase [Crossiella sp. S99.2]MCK2256274.1 N-6 DNA methylase [Crossiella sp. S99.1]